MAKDQLNVMIGSVLLPEEAARMAAADDRLNVWYEPDLYAPRAFPGDLYGTPGWRRNEEQQARFTQLCNKADAIFGLPDNSPNRLREVIAANPDLIWVHTMAAGGGAQVKSANLTSEDLARVTITTSAGIHAVPLAEFALFGALCGVKELPKIKQLQHDKVWASRWAIPMLTKQQVTIVGMGGIGKVTAEKFLALGAKVVGVNRSLKDIPGVEMHLVDDLEKVAATTDVLINCLPDAVGTEGLISAEVIAALPKGATIVSVGRGTCIDEDAMIQALQSGDLGFAALDVVAKEPLPTESPLWEMPNVIISPHTAALDPDEPDRIVDLFVANAQALLADQPMRNVMDTELFY